MSICAGTAHADGPLDLIPAGGLIIERPEGLSIDAEQLRIGFHSVRVSYLFANRGTRDIRTKVAFAVPQFSVCARGHGSECSLTLSYAKDANPMRFKVFVDGTPQTFRTDKQVRMRGGVEKRRLTHHWSQVFPKDRPVRIVYEYVPLAGSMRADPTDQGDDDRIERHFTEEYCVPINVVRELVKRMFGVHLVHYNLTAEPSAIRSFKLTIETRPDELVSACIPDLRRTSPTTFEVERHDFKPTNDLKIWFLSGARPDEIAAMSQAPAAPAPSGDPACSVRAKAITVGQSHTCALLSDETVRCWGANYVGQLGDGTTTFHSAPVPVTGLNDARAIAAGARHTCALRRLDDGVVCWGANEAGQAGHKPQPFAGFMGTMEPALKPKEVGGLVDVRAIAAGDSHTIAVTIPARSTSGAPFRNLPARRARPAGRKGYGGSKAPRASLPAQGSAVSGRAKAAAASARTFAGSARRASTRARR